MATIIGCNFLWISKLSNKIIIYVLVFYYLNFKYLNRFNYILIYYEYLNTYFFC